MSWNGHYWTVAPRVRSWIRPSAGPAGERPWRCDFEDPEAGALSLPGLLGDPGCKTLVVLVHGLGGSVDSTYMVRFANTVAERGLAWLRLGLRGSDRQGGDFYHAGLSGDLDVALASPALAHFEHVLVVGFSLGGHLALRFATHVEDDRVRAVAAVCSPVDLDATVSDFDLPGGWLYRKYILRSLGTMVEAMGEELPAGIDREALGRVRSLRGWDSLSVVPRFGFADATDYYRQAGVVHRLDQLRQPCLLVTSEGDPMVSARSIRGALDRKPPELEVIFTQRGGHVGFPPDLDLGFEGPLGLEHQVLTWLESRLGLPNHS